MCFGGERSENGRLLQSMLYLCPQLFHAKTPPTQIANGQEHHGFVGCLFESAVAPGPLAFAVATHQNLESNLLTKEGCPMRVEFRELLSTCMWVNKCWSGTLHATHAFIMFLTNLQPHNRAGLRRCEHIGRLKSQETRKHVRYGPMQMPIEA